MGKKLALGVIDFFSGKRFLAHCRVLYKWKKGEGGLFEENRNRKQRQEEERALSWFRVWWINGKPIGFVLGGFSVVSELLNAAEVAQKLFEFFENFEDKVLQNEWEK
ncbi:hypothetical protein CEXT_10311 [Caerostris extrusa]|uniref:Uncharacterized protein n=1 Tax=Caerostris extrusa TaxID=172846 RepID=A0AAV4RLD5_CAEEX|nr:hypothetical protein CEXT_10311 [Caerostris extrusa]